MRNDDYPEPTPTPVIWSVALGVAPLPFLGVYAVLFIAHGFVYPMNPPDITSTPQGEGIAGIVAAVLFLVGVVILWQFLNGRRRWPFVIGQVATFATAVDFILDRTTGSAAVPLLLVATSAAAIVLALLPAGWRHTGFESTRWQRARRAPRRAAAPAPAAPAAPHHGAAFGASDVDAAISSIPERSRT
jgi:hypothetical protein